MTRFQTQNHHPMKKLTILCLFGLSLYLISCQSNPNSSYQPLGEKTDIELRQELKQKEQQEFFKYLKVDYIKPRKNFFGETVVEGTISNNADLSSFKDIVLEITYMSKTQTALNVQNCTVYELLTSKKTVPFKYKTYAPKATEECSVRVINATPIEN